MSDVNAKQKLIFEAIVPYLRNQLNPIEVRFVPLLALNDWPSAQSVQYLQKWFETDFVDIGCELPVNLWILFVDSLLFIHELYIFFKFTTIGELVGITSSSKRSDQTLQLITDIFVAIRANHGEGAALTFLVEKICQKPGNIFTKIQINLALLKLQLPTKFML